MPTHEEIPRLLREYSRLTDQERTQFHAALQAFVRALEAWEAGGMRGRPNFPARLRVKAFQRHEGYWELSWAGDGRCLWRFGAPLRPDACHVVWLRIGTHEIFDDA